MYFVAFILSVVAGVLVFDYLVLTRKHRQHLVTLFHILKIVCRPSRVEGCPSPLAFVCATLRCLRTHVGRHVPYLGCSMVNTATCLGRNDNNKRCGNSREGIDART